MFFLRFEASEGFGVSRESAPDAAFVTMQSPMTCYVQSDDSCADPAFFSSPGGGSARLRGAIGRTGHAPTPCTACRPRTPSGLPSRRFFPTNIPNSACTAGAARLYDWYGIGQSLLMLPADMVGTLSSNCHSSPTTTAMIPAVRNIVVSYSTNILVNVLTALVCFRFLRQLGFTVEQSVAGVLALLFCTTHLHYTQNMMENNYIMLLTLTGFSFQYEWLRTGKTALLIGSAALGLNLLTRLTTGLDLMAAGDFSAGRALV